MPAVLRQTPGECLHAVGPDTHQHRSVTVFGNCQQSAANIRAGQQQVERDGESHGNHAGDKLRDRQQDPAEVDRAGQRRFRQRDEVRRKDPERRVAQQQREPEGREDLCQHRAAHHMADQSRIDDDAENKERDGRRHGERCRTATEPHDDQQRTFRA